MDFAWFEKAFWASFGLFGYLTGYQIKNAKEAKNEKFQMASHLLSHRFCR
ncbi:hypothetical protein [Endozoicomonas sp. YOMI1]|nr:hypothetical protein [Endozoicomonas sp. YOMI1]